MFARYKIILILALPIIGGQISQNILNIVDLAMVGRLGSVSVAAVGIASYTNFLAASFVMGLGAGVQALVARRIGEGQADGAVRALNGGLFLALVIGLPISLGLFFASEVLMGWLTTDQALTEQASDYFGARVLGSFFIGMNFAFRGYWNGISMSMVYMRTLIVMHVANILLNYMLIFGNFGFPALGVTGAGAGTAIATGLGTLLYFAQAYQKSRGLGFGTQLPKLASLLQVWRLSLPSCIQMFFFALGFTAMFWIIGQIGTNELAAANVLLSLVLLAILPTMGLGMASATLVGQALGRKDLTGAQRWPWDVVKVAFVVVGVMGLMFLFAPRFFLSIFLTDLDVIELAVWPLRMTAVMIIMEAFGSVFMSSLQGAGDTRSPMVVNLVTQWGIFMPLAFLLGPVFGFGIVAVWVVFGISRLLQALAFVVIWRRGRWREIDL